MSEAEGALARALAANAYRGSWSSDRDTMMPMRWDEDDVVSHILAALSADGWRVERDPDPDPDPVPESFSVNLTPTQAWRGGYVAGRRSLRGGPDATG